MNKQKSKNIGSYNPDTSEISLKYGGVESHMSPQRSKDTIVSDTEIAHNLHKQ